jgi:sterol 24-C-methyltransferase
MTKAMKSDDFLTKLRSKTTNKDFEQSATTYSTFWEADRNDVSDNTNVQSRKEQSAQITNKYYDLVTDFYEYGTLHIDKGWGASFHFAQMFRDSSFSQCVSRHENYLALKLQLGKGMNCLDAGCGVGMFLCVGPSVDGLRSWR